MLMHTPPSGRWLDSEDEQIFERHGEVGKGGSDKMTLHKSLMLKTIILGISLCYELTNEMYHMHY